MNSINQLLALIMVWFFLAGLFSFIYTLITNIVKTPFNGFSKHLAIALIGSFPGALFMSAGIKGLWILFA